MEKKFAFLIITGIPDKTGIGIDFLEINATKEFRGIKFIPSGPHFIYSSPRDNLANTSIDRSGFFHFFRPGEVLVKEWNHENEELQNRSKEGEAAQLEIQRIKENLMDLDRFLAIYDYNDIGKWINLTNLLTQDSINRLSPECKLVRSSVAFKSLSDQERPKGKSATAIRNIRIRTVDDERKYLPQMELISGTLPKFSNIPERYNKFSTPEEKTSNNIDTIILVDKLLNDITSTSNILEELQFSFILYLCCLSIESFVHWRQIISLFCNSEQAVAKYSLFYKHFINTIKHQIVEIPTEYSEQSSLNTIYMDIKSLLKNLILNNFQEKADILKDHLENTLSWSFFGLLEEDPEDLPQIVEIDSISYTTRK